LIGLYLLLVNAVAHIGQALALRRYNPGLVTAVLLFVPLGWLGVRAVTAAGHGGWGYQAMGLGSALAIHAAIIAHVRARLR
jgi:hypothetical protein